MSSIPPVILKNELHFEQSQQILRSLSKDSIYVDISLDCADGISIPAHRAILAHTSPYLENLIKQNETSKNLSLSFRSGIIKNILEYLYIGETKVELQDVKDFLSATSTLQIRKDEEEKQKKEEKVEIVADWSNDNNFHDADIKDNYSSDDDFIPEVKYEDEEDKEDREDKDYVQEKIKVKKEKDPGKVKKGKGRGRPKGAKNNPRDDEEKNEFPCNLCDFVATKKREMWKHKRESHEAPRSYQCEYCEYSGSKAGLYAHREIHTNERMYCDKCNYSTLKKVHFINHQKYVHFEGEYINCDEEGCNFRCKKQKELRYHKERKHEGKIFFCDKCEYTSRFSYRLRDHIKGVHEGNKYQCPKCNYSTIHQSVMYTHIKVEHEATGKHLCTHCGFQTSRKYNLNAHIRSMHLGMKREQKKAVVENRISE